MRDILLCKKCKHFVENGFDICKVSGWWMGKWRPSLYRIHSCIEDGLAFGLSHNREFYLMETPTTCPYRLEQEMYDINAVRHLVDYGFWSRFKRNRVCQHCGRIIRNRRKCPICGYNRFDVVYADHERAWRNWAAVFIVIVGIAFIVFMMFKSHLIP